MNDYSREKVLHIHEIQHERKKANHCVTGIPQTEKKKSLLILKFNSCIVVEKCHDPS